MKQRDYYAFLGVRRSATAEEINKAFREKAMELHPDRNKGKPQAAEEFKTLTQVLQTLTDPVRRAKYDSTLPPEEAPARTPGAAPSGLTELWKAAAKVFFEREERFTPAIDGMRDSVPLSLENDELIVVGISPVNSYLIGYLESSETRLKVRNILTELRGKPTDFRVVSGTSLADWEAVKVAEERWHEKRKAQEAARMAAVSVTVATHGKSHAQPPAPDARSITLIPPMPGAAPSEGPAPEAPPPAPAPALAQAPETSVAAGGESWDELLDRMMRQWNGTENRTYVQIRAKFVFDLLPAIARVEERMRAAGEAEELRVRNVNRVLERLANLAGIEAGVVGLEYLRFKRLIGGGL